MPPCDGRLNREMFSRDLVLSLERDQNRSKIDATEPSANRTADFRSDNEENLPGCTNLCLEEKSGTVLRIGTESEKRSVPTRLMSDSSPEYRDCSESRVLRRHLMSKHNHVTAADALSASNGCETPLQKAAMGSSNSNLPGSILNKKRCLRALKNAKYWSKYDSSASANDVVVDDGEASLVTLIADQKRGSPSDDSACDSDSWSSDTEYTQPKLRRWKSTGSMSMPVPILKKEVKVPHAQPCSLPNAADSIL